VVVDDGVHERRAGAGLVVGALRCAGCGWSVPFALLASHEAVTAADRDVAELRDVDVDQRPGVRMLVAAKRLTGDPVDTRQPLIRHRTKTACTVEAGTASWPAT
jgi:hypothetical protein